MTTHISCGKLHFARGECLSKISGVYNIEVPPVPIPNTVVKLNCAENTWRAAARENRSSPTSAHSSECAFCFLKQKSTRRPTGTLFLRSRRQNRSEARNLRIFTHILTLYRNIPQDKVRCCKCRLRERYRHILCATAHICSLLLIPCPRDSGE